MEKVIADSQARLKAEDAMRLRKGDLEEDIDRDSAWVKRLGWVKHFGSRDLLDVFEAAEWIRAKAAINGRARQEDEQWAYHITPDEALDQWGFRFTVELATRCSILAGRRWVHSSHNSGFCSGRTRESHSDDDNDSSEDEVGVEAVLAFRDQHAAWMYIGTHTVASTIIRWMAMAYGNGWREKVGGQSPIRWSEDGQALFPNGERILIDDSTQTLQGQVTEAEKLLDQLSAGSWEKIGQIIDLDRINDNMARLGAV
ncbi:hypothetical protein QSH57_004138 [Fusarium oxysporum f. sp. vasinfectum]|nr:hypothetical protein QSH57_004138 [Fusarium oxysporum f. sp. vasinfectum]